MFAPHGTTQPMARAQSAFVNNTPGPSVQGGTGHDGLNPHTPIIIQENESQTAHKPNDGDGVSTGTSSF